MRKASKIVSVILSATIALSMFTTLPISASAAETETGGSDNAKITEQITENTSAPSDEITETVDERTDVADLSDTAATDEPDKSAYTSAFKNSETIPAGTTEVEPPAAGDYITRAEWLHNLVVTFDMKVFDDNYPDNYFSDITAQDEYYKDILLALEFGVVDVELGGELKPNDYVTRDFAASTLNLCLGYELDEGEPYTYDDYQTTVHPDDAQIAINRGWLTPIDNNFSQNLPVTAEEATNMISDAQSTLKNSTVQDNYNNSFNFKEGVIVVPQTTKSVIQDNVVTLTNSTVAISQGDTFVVYFGEIPNVYIAESVEQSGNQTVISTQEANFEEAIETADAQGVEECNAADIVPADGVELDIEEEEVTPVSSSSVIASGASGTKRIKEINAKKSFKLGDITVDISCNLSNLTADYIVKSGFGNSHYYIRIDGDASVTSTASVKDIISALGDSSSIDLLSYSVPGVGKVAVSLYVSVSGSITVKYTTSFAVGAEYYDGKFRSIKSFEKNNFSVAANVKCDIGLKAYANLNVVNVIKGNAWARFGAVVSMDTENHNDGKSPTTCTTLTSWLYADAGCSISISALGIINKSYSFSADLFNSRTSPFRVRFHYEDGKKVTSCNRRTGYMYTTSGYSRYGSCGLSNGSSGDFDDSGEPIIIWEYSLDDNNNATITKYSGNAYVLMIPKTIDGYTVTGIEKNAFKGNRYLSIVTMPDSITTINEYAFGDCTNLENVKLSKGLTYLGQQAFGNCTALTGIEIPKSLEECSTYSYDGPFYNCSKLKEVTFENGVTRIAEKLFSGCSGIQSINIPNTVTSIDSYAFRNCSNLTSVTIPNSVTTIGKNAFEDCSKISAVSIPDSVTTINEYAFGECTNLDSVKLSKGLTYLGQKVFGNCTALTEIEIPKSLERCSTYSYDGPFYNCSKLKEITFETGVTRIAEKLFSGCTGIESISIPNTVTSIDSYAFRNCSNLTSVTIPNSVTTIGKNAFEDCSKISAVSIPDSVTTINEYAFWECTNLDSVKLSKGLTYLGQQAFGNCTALTEIEIPKSLERCSTYSYDGPFYNCSKLKDVTFETGVTRIAEKLFSGCTGIESISIPNTVTSIDSYAFKNCTGLTQIIIPDSVVSMGKYIFFGCTALQKATLQNSPEDIPEFTFLNCSSLTEVKYPDSVKNIRKEAFSGCTSLESIKLSPNLELIESYAFNGCSALKKVVVPDKVKSIGSYAYQGCTSLSSITIPSSVKTIGKSAFQGCELLADVKIADYSVETISSSTFKDCPALKAIVLPKGLKTISSLAFANDTALTEVTIPESVTSITTDAFSYPAKMTVYGYTDSYAKTYCDERAIKFVDNHILTEGLCLDPKFNDYIVLDTGEVIEVGFEVYPLDSNDVITLTSNNTRVSINGMHITAKSSGDCVITATATSGVSYDFTVHVRSVKSVSIQTMPTKTTYTQGDKLDLSGLVLNVNYNDSTSEIVSEYAVSGYNPDEIGVQTVTLSYTAANGSVFKATFDVEVVDPKGHLIGISIKQLPNKIKYAKYDKLDTTGLIVVEDYDTGNSYEITDYKVTGYNALKLGEQTITVSKGEYSATFTVTVVEKLEEVKLGDINSDGIISIADAIMVQKHIANIAMLTSDARTAADVTKDGAITISDAIMLQKHIANIITIA